MLLTIIYKNHFFTIKLFIIFRFNCLKIWYISNINYKFVITDENDNINLIHKTKINSKVCFTCGIDKKIVDFNEIPMLLQNEFFATKNASEL